MILNFFSNIRVTLVFPNPNQFSKRPLLLTNE
jgi:hypothetical protein